MLAFTLGQLPFTFRTIQTATCNVLILVSVQFINPNKFWKLTVIIRLFDGKKEMSSQDLEVSVVLKVQSVEVCL